MPVTAEMHYRLEKDVDGPGGIAGFARSHGGRICAHCPHGTGLCLGCAALPPAERQDCWVACGTLDRIEA